MNNEHYLVDKPLKEGLVLLRGKGGEACTNVEQKIVRHSPDGFEWGYGRSGPLDLGLNLVEQILTGMNYRGLRTEFERGSCFILATKLYRDFTNDVIAQANRDGDFIPYETLHSWVETHMDLQPV